MEDFYTAFIDTAEYLDINQLYQACLFDPYWSKILQTLERQKNYNLGNKIFFVYKNILMCKDQYKNVYFYKIIIPDILSHNFVYNAHRHYFCIKSKKLENQINLKFEIRNLNKIIEQVVKNCSNCSMTARVPTGTNRQSLPKNPVLLRNKFRRASFGVRFS